MGLPINEVTRAHDARVLDATASNRAIWRKKESRHVLWIDIEPELERQPDLVLDCTATGFEAGRFHTIFFDPPHWWGDRLGENIFSCRNEAEKKAFERKYNMKGGGISYYGGDKFRTKPELLIFIHKAQKEFHRILADDGILWFTWSEVRIPLNNVLPFFKNWDEMIRLMIGSNLQNVGKSQNYWVMFMKKNGPRQAELTGTFTNGVDILDKKKVNGG